MSATLPLFRFSKLLVVPQFLVSLSLLKESVRLLSAWNDKKIKYKILIGKNKAGFRPDSFKVFMQAPCGRLLAKAVLKDLGIPEKYNELLCYKTPLFTSVRKSCGKQETKIYINEDFK